MARRAALQSSLPYTRQRIWPPSAPRVGPWYGRRSAPSSVYNLVFIVYSALRRPLSASIGIHFGTLAMLARAGPTPGRPADSPRLTALWFRATLADASKAGGPERLLRQPPKSPFSPFYEPGQSFGWNREFAQEKDGHTASFRFGG